MNKNNNPQIEIEKIKDKFNKKKELYKEKINLFKEKYIRTLAEFDNYKKRNDKEKIDLFKINSANIIKSILPILDDFKRLIKEEKISKKDGIYLIYLKFRNILKDNGLKKINVNIGDIFNPDYHDAVSQIQDKNMKNKIVQIVEDGYYVYNNIVRCTKVIVGY